MRAMAVCFAVFSRFAPARAKPGRNRLGRGLTFVAVALAGALHAETLTIATYNVENYGPANRVTEAGFRPDYPKPENEKQALRRIIGAVNADVLVLQEMGGEPYLRELQRDLRAEGCDYAQAVVANGPDADRHIALLSKRPLVNVTTLANVELAYFGAKERVKRGVLMATLSTPAGELTIFAVHLKSRLTERPDDPLSAVRRTAEATAVRDVVLRRFPDPARVRFLILGDCNDTKDSKTLERLQHRGSTRVAALLPARDDRGESWTYFYKREDSYARVDHILVSASLAECVVGQTARIYSGEDALQASDHRPVLVRLELPAAGTASK